MRRGAPPPQLRVDPSAVGPWSVVQPTSRGLRLAPAPPPDGEHDPGEPLQILRGAPFPANEVQIVSSGALALVAGPGLARTIHLPRLTAAFDRRPPGVSRVVGAAASNAGLLHDDAGWRAVVLPSLGDLAADLGPGPVALRADGRRIALAVEGGIEELDLPGGEAVARHEVSTNALAYACDGRLVVAAGAGAGPPGTPPADGSPVVSLAAAAEAPRLLARHADGSCSLVDAGGTRHGRFPAPLEDAPSMSLSADGALAAFGAASAVAVVRAADGAWVRRIEGARAIALATSPVGAMLLGGDFGVIWLERPAEPE